MTGVVAAALGALAPAATAMESVDRDDTYPIAKVTGPGPLNYTGERWNVLGTDMGQMFEHEGRIYMVFGDTFGPDLQPEPNADWRSNTMAYFRDADPAVGPLFDGMIEDRPGHAGELLSSRKDDQEITVIPTHGISVHGRMVLHYMSIHDWLGQEGDTFGHLILNESGLAYSDDDGRTWTKDPQAKWPGNSNFGHVAFVQVEKYVYMFGIPGGRVGGVKLARVPAARILDLSAYRYWNGADWTGKRAEVERIIGSSARAHEVGSASDYGLVVPPLVGELSVQWNSHYRKWLMTYARIPEGGGANVDEYGLAIRTADCLTGPWSDEKFILTHRDYPTSYAPFIPPRWNNGPDIYFNMSVYGVQTVLPPAPYNILWMHTSLDGVAPAPRDKCVTP